MLFNKFATGLTIFALSTATLAAPARAGDDDVAKAIGGLLTLFVIGKALENANRDDRPQNTTVNRPNRRSPFAIPAQCVVEIDRRHGPDTSVAIKRCLDRERQARSPLPRRCEVDVRARRGNLDAYDMECLNRFGYRVADRRRN